MKKSFVVLSFMVLSLAAYSQDALGWKFSVNFAPMITWTAASDKLESNGSRMGFDFGITGEHYFTERYAYFGGLSLMNVGGKVAASAGDTVGFHSGATLVPGQEAQLRLQYLSIPVGLKFKTPDYGMLAYYFQAALFPGVRIGGSGSTSSKSVQGQDLKGSDYNPITFGMQLGAGTMYSTGDNTYLKVGLSFNYFFMDALRGDPQAKPAGIGLNLGFLF